MDENKEKGCVYFFRHIGLTPVKIGYSKHPSPIDRFAQFKTYAPYGSEIIGFIQTDSAKEIEKFLHQKFSSFRLDGEWFEITEEQVIKEVDFYSSKEDIKERNDFQIAWANKILERTELTENNNVQDSVFLLMSKGVHFNKTKLADELGVSRKTIFKYVNRFNGLKK